MNVVANVTVIVFFPLQNAETGATIALNMPTKDIAKHMNMFEFNAHILAKKARKIKIVIFQ